MFVVLALLAVGAISPLALASAVFDGLPAAAVLAGAVGLGLGGAALLDRDRRWPVRWHVVGGAGLVSLGVMRVFTWVISEQMVPWQAVVVFGVAANVCYLLGPTVELVVDRLWGRKLLPIGPALYRMGLTFSVGLALLPALIFSIMSVVVVVLKMFGAA